MIQSCPLGVMQRAVQPSSPSSGIGRGENSVGETQVNYPGEARPHGTPREGAGKGTQPFPDRIRTGFPTDYLPVSI